MDNAVDTRLTAVLSADEITALQGLGIAVTLKTGAVLFSESEESSHAILLKSGTVKIIANAKDGQELVLAVRGPGDIVGEMAAIDGHPRSATAVAAAPVDAFMISAADFNEFVDAHPKLLRFLLLQVMQRLREADERRMELATMPVTARVAICLLELAGLESTHQDLPTDPVTVPATQHELAGYVGASREAVAKVLKLLRQNDTISTAYGSITLHDVPALARTARGDR